MRAALAAALFFAAPQLAWAQTATDTVALEPGKYRWIETPQTIKASTAAEPVRLVVSLIEQQARVYQGDRLVGVTTVSTGAPGYDTPTGTFEILQKKVFHRSNLYDDAPMPFMQRLTWDGIALHAGSLPGYPDSHGCIRLPKTFAKQLFDMTAMGGSVEIIDGYFETLDPAAPTPVLADSPDLGGGGGDVRAAAQATPQPASWVRGSGEGAAPTALR